MKLEHIAVASNSEEDADRFFIDLLGMKKMRSLTISADLTKQFFGINKEQKIIRYSSQNLEMEVFITNDTSKVRDRFTHFCISTENCENLTNKASSMGFTVIKIPRKESNAYYFFIKDAFGNAYEIK
jgi:catechol 2,3-dioxygenase-like lactoylglutathione lyase family enzyme